MTSNYDPSMKTQLERALSFNSEMQAELVVMRDKLETLLTTVKSTYEANDLLLKEGLLRKKRTGVGMKGAYLKGSTFYLKGNMFFRDIKCRTCPNNKDYEKRKRENEMFPMDFNLRARHVWSTADKQGIILGIKEQIIDHLKLSSKRYGKKSKVIDSEKLTKLLNMAPDDFRIDWDYISSANLLHRHSAKNCEAIWNLFLHPSLNRSSWSKEENNKLLEAAKKYDFQNWPAIAKEVGQRSDFQCFVQYKNNVYQNLPEPHTKWSKEDDKRLLDAIARNTVNGNINWSIVNTYFPHKAKTTLHSRYNSTLNPNIQRGAPFTTEEDLLLIAAVKEYGKRFGCIPRSLFPNRSVVQLRTHYNNVLAKRHKHHPWSLEDDITLMNFVSENGMKWVECEKRLEERHTRLSCRTRYVTIKKYLERHPGSTIENLPRKKSSIIRKNVNFNNWKQKVEEISLSSNGVKSKAKKRVEKKVGKDKPERTKKDKTKKRKKEGEDNKSEHEPAEQMAIETKAKNNYISKVNKPYISRLRTNERKNYDFFKYAYSFELKRHPCDFIQIKVADFSIVTSALKPQIPFYDFDTSIPRRIKDNIEQIAPELSSCQTLELLPPNWSTAMGFRALCINTASILPILSYRKPTNDINNEYIQRFRERLRFIFFSTALLSRLSPEVVGINTVINDKTPKTFRRKRYHKGRKDSGYDGNKKKRGNTLTNLQAANDDKLLAVMQTIVDSER